MTYALSRLMSMATMSYGAYSLAEPRHLGRFLTGDGKDQARYDVLAQSYGARDVAVSLLGVVGSERTVKASMLIRIACDISDGLLLANRTKDEDTRTMLLGATFGWAALNALALRVDRRRAKSRRLEEAAVVVPVERYV